MRRIPREGSALPIASQCNSAGDDCLFDRTENATSARVEDLEPDDVPWAHVGRERSPAFDGLARAALGEAGDPARWVPVRHGTATEDRPCREGPGLGDVRDELGEGEVHLGTRL